MQQTFERTARGYSKKQIKNWNAGGKTGTSDQRAGFIGFAGDLVLVWLGLMIIDRPLTGRTGAFKFGKLYQ